MSFNKTRQDVGSRLKLLSTISETHTLSEWRYLLWPTQHGEGKERGGEPSIKDISICGPQEGTDSLTCSTWT